MMSGEPGELPSLAETCCFGKLTPSLLLLSGENLDRLAFAPGDVIFHEGDPADTAYIVIKGDIELLTDTSEGLVLMATVAPQQSFGELALFCDGPRLCTARARSHVEVLRLTRPAYTALAARYPDIAHVIIASLSRRLAAALRALRIARTIAKLAPAPALQAQRPSIFTC